jgi:phenylalanyl-tRNA synthetase alpha subunit
MILLISILFDTIKANKRMSITGIKRALTTLAVEETSIPPEKTRKRRMGMTSSTSSNTKDVEKYPINIKKSLIRSKSDTSISSIASMGSNIVADLDMQSTSPQEINQQYTNRMKIATVSETFLV